MIERIVLVSDLDGSLLDHDTYAWSPAQPALDRLDALGIDLVPASSKTPAEIEHLLERMGREGPWIAENGAVLGERGSGQPALTDSHHDAPAPRTELPTYRELRELLGELRRSRHWRFEGFGDWDPPEIARRTGLDHAAAERASRRRATEPLLWLEPELSPDALRDELEARGLKLVAGGRFLTAGPDLDKADGARELLRRHHDRWPDPVLVAAGDSPNDRSLLASADWALVIPRPDGRRLDVRGRRGTLVAPSPGPTGWNAVVLELLSILQTSATAPPHCTNGEPHG